LENSSDKELEPRELEEILSKLKESVQSDVRQTAVWNTLGFILLKTGRVQVQILGCSPSLYSNVLKAYMMFLCQYLM